MPSSESFTTDVHVESRLPDWSREGKSAFHSSLPAFVIIDTRRDWLDSTI